MHKVTEKDTKLFFTVVPRKIFLGPKSSPNHTLSLDSHHQNNKEKEAVLNGSMRETLGSVLSMKRKRKR